MIKLNIYKKCILYVVLVLLFIAMMNWTVMFAFLRLEDLRLMVIIVASTLILLLLGTENLKDYQALSHKLRFNLFFTSMLMTLILMFSMLSEGGNSIGLNRIVFSLKPLVFSLMIYLPTLNILNRLKHKQADSSQDFSAIIKVLSRRETEVFHLVMKGCNNKEIAEQLFIAEATVKKHIQHILKKTQCEDRYQLMNQYPQVENK